MVQAGAKDAAPFVLHMDLQMDAPVITMPRFSDSNDNVKVDLGAVHLSNSIAWQAGSSISDPKASSCSACAWPEMIVTIVVTTAAKG